MIAKNSHLKEAMANLNGKLEDKNKKIKDWKAFVSDLEGKIVEKNNEVI